MEKKFKHKITGEIITYKDGVIKSGTFVLDMGEQVVNIGKKPKNLSIGT